MRGRRFAPILLALLLAAAPRPVHATVPSTMSYQGVLTDNAGNLVPDGLYNFVFKMYDVGSGGVALWTETQNNIPLTKGGLAVILGSVTPLNLAFDRQYYLGIGVNGGAELVPRVILASSPQAMALRLPFAGSESSAGTVLSVTNSGSGGAIVGDPSVVGGSSTTNGTLGVTGPGATGLTGALRDNPAGASLELYRPSGGFLSGLVPDLSGDGAFYFAETSGFYGGRMGADGTGSDDPYFFMVSASNFMSFDLSQSGDPAVRLPASAISAGEILDEPGIAQNRSNGGPAIPTGSNMSDLVSVTITTPADGYIVVDADGMHGIGGNGATENEADLSISDTPGGPLDTNHWFVSGFTAAAPSGLTRMPVSMRRTFSKPAGTYTFYFQGRALNPSALANYMWQPNITATYIPTSYGIVTALVSSADAAREGLAGSRVQVAVGPGGEHVDADAVSVDLRDLELRAAKARAEAERAQRRLLEARMRLTRTVPPAASGAVVKP